MNIRHLRNLDSLQSKLKIFCVETFKVYSNNSLNYHRVAVEESSIKWLAEICDGDARIALNSLQLAMESLQDNNNGETKLNLKFMPLSSIKDGIKVSACGIRVLQLID